MSCPALPGLGRCLLAWCLAVTPLLASDHGDMAVMATLGRNDSRTTDLHVFTRQNHLVLALCVNPAVPISVAHYVFASDLTLRIHVDRHSEVAFDSVQDRNTYGGTILDPARVSADVVFEITFDDQGQPKLDVEGLPKTLLKEVQFFAGLRDDPFIRGGRERRNVAAVVLEMPLASILDQQSTLLVWGTSKVPELHGPIIDHVGRSLRSMMPENDAFNGLQPRDHFKELGAVPDVIVYNTAQPASYPNGRELIDDVVDLVGDPRITTTDGPTFPSANDVAFLATFPYLAPPHPAR